MIVAITGLINANNHQFFTSSSSGLVGHVEYAYFQSRHTGSLLSRISIFLASSDWFRSPILADTTGVSEIGIGSARPVTPSLVYRASHLFVGIFSEHYRSSPDGLPNTDRRHHRFPASSSRFIEILNTGSSRFPREPHF